MSLSRERCFWGEDWRDREDDGRRGALKGLQIGLMTAQEDAPGEDAAWSVITSPRDFRADPKRGCQQADDFFGEELRGRQKADSVARDIAQVGPLGADGLEPRREEKFGEEQTTSAAEEPSRAPFVVGDGGSNPRFLKKIRQ